MTDNVIKLDREKKTPKPPVEEECVAIVDEKPLLPSADEMLTAALGKYEGVIIIGVKGDSAQLSSTLDPSQAVYEISRAMHRLHCYIDRG